MKTHKMILAALLGTVAMSSAMLTKDANADYGNGCSASAGPDCIGSANGYTYRSPAPWGNNYAAFADQQMSMDPSLIQQAEAYGNMSSLSMRIVPVPQPRPFLDPLVEDPPLPKGCSKWGNNGCLNCNGTYVFGSLNTQGFDMYISHNCPEYTGSCLGGSNAYGNTVAPIPCCQDAMAKACLD